MEAEMSSSVGKHNLERFLRMQKPFATEADALKAITAFYDDIEKAREKHCLADVHIIVMTPSLNEDGIAVPGLSSLHLGDSRRGEEMCAWGYATESSARRKEIQALMDEARQK